MVFFVNIIIAATEIESIERGREKKEGKKRSHQFNSIVSMVERNIVVEKRINQKFKYLNKSVHELDDNNNNKKAD